jgi:hypothetical protein
LDTLLEIGLALRTADNLRLSLVAAGRHIKLFGVLTDRFIHLDPVAFPKADFALCATVRI